MRIHIGMQQRITFNFNCVGVAITLHRGLSEANVQITLYSGPGIDTGNWQYTNLSTILTCISTPPTQYTTTTTHSSVFRGGACPQDPPRIVSSLWPHSH